MPSPTSSALARSASTPRHIRCCPQPSSSRGSSPPRPLVSPTRASNVASLFANYFWLDNYEPYFRESWACLLAFQALGMSCILMLRYMIKQRKKHFERLAVRVNQSDAAAMGRLTEEEQRAVVNGYRYIIYFSSVRLLESRSFIQLCRKQLEYAQAGGTGSVVHFETTRHQRCSLIPPSQ